MSNPPSPISVLIVEDEVMVLATLKASLQLEGLDVTALNDPLKALEAVRKKEFSVIISDHKMPVMLGLDFLAECRQIWPNSSRILLTAVLDLATVIDAINQGVICRFIAKPWLRQELLAAVRDGASRHELAAHNQALLEETTRLKGELAAARAH